MNSRLPRLLAGLALIVVAVSLREHAPAGTPPRAERPRLIIVITIDQFRNDYLDRFRPHFVEGGFNMLLQGARFTNCFHAHAVTATGPGHASLATGAHPRTHGIIGNDWYDREQKRIVNCVEDPRERQVASALGPEASRGASPRLMSGSTFGDELRQATNFESKVISISLKDRGAILPGGRTANAAYWFSTDSGRFVSSTYYMNALPEWAERFNSSAPGRKYCGKPWQALPETPGAGGRTFREFKSEDDPGCESAQFYQWLRSSPYITDVQLAFALEAVRQEDLGQRGVTDFLAVSLSANDAVGHTYGPYSPQVADVTLRTDRALAGFLSEIDSLVGLKNVWILLSADHGVAPTPAFIKEHRLGRGNSPIPQPRTVVQDALTQALGKGEWVEAASAGYIYLNRTALAKKRVEPEVAERVAAQALERIPGAAAVLTRSQLVRGGMVPRGLAEKAALGFNADRSGDVMFILEPFALPNLPETQATHGSPWNYDAHVPLIFWGKAFRPGTYHTPCQTVDMAPTLSAALGLSMPSGVEGKPLMEAIAPPKAK